MPFGIDSPRQVLSTPTNGILKYSSLEMSILEKADLDFERAYGIDRIYETIYLYGDSEWKDSLGQQAKSCPNCDILIKLHAGMFFPTIEARSKPENEFAFLYTQNLKERLLTRANDWVEIVDAKNTGKITYYSPSRNETVLTKPDDFEKYVVGKPKFVKKSAMTLKMNADNAKLHKTYIQENPTSVAYADLGFFDFYHNKIQGNVKEFLKQKGTPAPVKPNVTVKRPNVAVKRPNVAVKRPNVALKKPNVTAKTPNALAGRKYNGKLLRKIDSKHGWPIWYNPETKKYTWDQPTFIEADPSSVDWVQRTDPKDRRFPYWVSYGRKKVIRTMPPEYARAMGIPPEKLKRMYSKPPTSVGVSVQTNAPPSIGTPVQTVATTPVQTVASTPVQTVTTTPVQTVASSPKPQSSWWNPFAKTKKNVVPNTKPNAKPWWNPLATKKNVVPNAKPKASPWWNPLATKKNVVPNTKPKETYPLVKKNAALNTKPNATKKNNALNAKPNVPAAAPQNLSFNLNEVQSKKSSNMLSQLRNKESRQKPAALSFNLNEVQSKKSSNMLAQLRNKESKPKTTQLDSAGFRALLLRKHAEQQAKGTGVTP